MVTKIFNIFELNGKKDRAEVQDRLCALTLHRYDLCYYFLLPYILLYSYFPSGKCVERGIMWKLFGWPIYYVLITLHCTNLFAHLVPTVGTRALSLIQHTGESL